MHVQVIDRNTGEVISRYLITLGSLNGTLSEKDYFDEAWNNAVEDKLVLPRDKDRYNFRIVE